MGVFPVQIFFSQGKHFEQNNMILNVSNDFRKEIKIVIKKSKNQ